MKTVTLLIAVVFVVILSPAQPVTNWITAAPNFREVDGKLYNVEKSKLFHEFHGKCEGVSSNSIAVTPIQDKSVTPVTAANNPAFVTFLEGKGFWDGQTIIVRNYPTNNLPAKGVDVGGYAMKVGTIELKSGVYELWDYGTPHRVAQVTGVATNSVK
jgi:hypothetical protein